MNTRNIAFEMYSAIAAGLVQDESWPVATPNFIRYDNVEGIQNPDKFDTAEADFPQATLEGPVSGETSLSGDAPVFATHSDTPPAHWLENGKYTFRLTTVSEVVSLKQTTPLTLETIAAVRRLGPKLGLSYVTDVRVKWESKESIEDGNNTKQITTVITITVTVEIDGDELTGE